MVETLRFGNACCFMRFRMSYETTERVELKPEKGYRVQDKLPKKVKSHSYAFGLIRAQYSRKCVQRAESLVGGREPSSKHECRGKVHSINIDAFYEEIHWKHSRNGFYLIACRKPFRMRCLSLISRYLLTGRSNHPWTLLSGLNGLEKVNM